MPLTRRELLELSVLAFGAAACGSSSSGSSAAGGNCLANGTAAAIAGNHGHVLTVSKADVAAGVDKTYDITGTATHSHSVTITAAMFAELAANIEADTTSTLSVTAPAHSHAISVTCV